MDTPVQAQPVAQPAAEPQQVTGPAPVGTGASVAEEFIRRAQAAGAVVPPGTPSVPQPVRGPEPQSVYEQPPQPQVQQPQVQQPQVPAPVRDFSARFGGEQPVDPVASLEHIPDLAPEQKIEPPQNLDEKQNHAWAAMRAQMAESRRQAEDFRQKYNGIVDSAKQYQAEKTEFGNKLNAKDARIKELEDELGKMDLSRSPEFKQRYDAPISGIRDEISKLLVANGYEEAQSAQLAEQIVLTESAKVPEMLTQLPTHVQGMIMIHAQNADRLWGERDQALQNWKQSAEGLAAVAARGSAVVNAQRIAQLAEKAIATAKGLPVDQLAPAFQVTDDQQFIADRDAQEQKFKAWVQSAPEEQKYVAMFEGFMAGKTYEMLQQTWLENQQLKGLLYQRGRLGTPPVYPVRSAPPAPPAAPPVAPPKPADQTIATVGAVQASQNDGVDYAQRFMAAAAAAAGGR